MAAGKQIRAILFLPGTVAVAIPALILYRGGFDTLDLVDRAPALRILLAVFGVLLVVVGITLFVATNRAFALIGRGTLAPWDPPRKLIVVGVYRRVRNPMISGVFAVLLGETLVTASIPLLALTLLFAAVNAIYIPLVEERGLLRRFGADYETYRRHVPRWIPRPTPWQPEG